MEMLVVIVIVGILTTLAMTQYGAYREKTFDREAQAYLRTIAAAERVVRMESNTNQYIGCANNAQIITNLRVDIPTSNPTWNYSILVNATGSWFCAQATRVVGGRAWSIRAPTVLIPDPQTVSGACP